MFIQVALVSNALNADFSDTYTLQIACTSFRVWCSCSQKSFNFGGPQILNKGIQVAILFSIKNG